MVKIKNTMLAVLCGLSLILAGSWAFSREQAKDADQGAHKVADWTMFEARWLIGHEVRSFTGTSLGRIGDLVIDRENGRIALVVLSAVPNLRGKELPIPFVALMRTGENDFQLGFHDRELTDLSSRSDLYGVPSRIDPNWVGRVYRRYGQPAYWTQIGQKPLSSKGLYRADRLVGSNIRTLGGGETAVASDLLVDSKDGHIIFLILSGVQGKGAALVAVPFSLLSKKGGNGFVLDITRQKLAEAPSFGTYAAMTSQGYALDVYDYLNVA